MNPELAGAVRAELVSIGTKNSRLQHNQRRSRALVLTIGAVAIAGAITGAAIVVNNLPGTTTVAPLGGVVAATRTGTGALDLGPVPARAGAVIVDLTCLNKQGTVTVQTKPQVGSTGSSVSVDCSLRTEPVHIDDGLLPKAGSTSITVTADPDTTWRATAQYASSSTTAWGVNANGQTYGVPNGNGLPDLQAARATNGKQGYILTAELFAFEGSGHINVYGSDGTTVIGEFPIGDVDGWSYTATTDAPTAGN